MKRLVVSSVATLCAVLAASTALAFPDPPPPPLPPPPAPPLSTSAPPPATAPTAPTPPARHAEERRDASPGAAGDNPDEARHTDANADRVILTSTAETHPKGTFYFTDYELFFLQFGYAITDNFQLALSGVPPLFKDQPYFFDLAAKVNVLRTESFRAAVIGGLDTIIATGSSNNSDSTSKLFGARIGGVGQFCFDGFNCHHSVSLNGHVLINDQSNRVVPVILGAGFTFRASQLVKFNFEPMYFAAVGSSDVAGTTNFFSANYGIRLSGKQWGVDLSFIRPFGSNTKDVTDKLIMGIPWVSFTYRTEGEARGAK